MKKSKPKYKDDYLNFKRGIKVRRYIYDSKKIKVGDIVTILNMKDCIYGTIKLGDQVLHNVNFKYFEFCIKLTNLSKLLYPNAEVVDGYLMI